ncbi:MAG: divisome protein SepX/GlpR [Nakamurella sp.]
MPNLPTSLILVLLAAAWLVVLVPMFARSREAVPETDDTAAGFRVLRRAGAALRRPRMRRDRNFDDEWDDAVVDDAVVDDAVVDDTVVDGDDDDRAGRRLDAELRIDDDEDENLVEELVDSDDDDGDLDDDDDDDDDDVADDESDDFAEVEREPALVGASTRAHHLDAADEWVSEHQRLPMHTTSHARPRPSDPRADRRDVQRPTAEHPLLAAPKPNRHGRGGFDPEHAAATAAYRYRRRRFVSLLLLVLTLGLAAGAVMINSTLWVGGGLAALTLVGYLVYLSRQVRIERAISERRMARLRRAKEIRPIQRREAAPESPYQRKRAPHAGPDQRLAARVTGVQRRAGVVVDLDDDDPAFDDLEYYEPIVYRRAAGQ